MTVAGQQDNHLAAVSQIAIELIGRHRIKGSVKLGGGYTNKVWRVICDGDGPFIVKQYRSRWACENEYRAISLLGAPLAQRQPVIARSATVLIWPDDGLEAVTVVDEGLLRSVGYHLGMLHALNVPESVALSQGDARRWRLADRILDRAKQRTNVPEMPSQLIHGDPNLQNVLATPGGRFARFCDFEEFGLGDPRADFFVCAVEVACAEPGKASDWVRWFFSGYMGAGNAMVYLPIGPGKTGIVEAFVNSTHDELLAWASQNSKFDLMDRYSEGYRAAISAICDTLAAGPPA